MQKITLAIALCCLPFITLAQQVKELPVTSTQASSEYPSEGRVKYDPGQAVDHNNNTAWFPQRTSRANKGEWIKLDLQQLSDIKEIKIINGWIESLGNWQHNSRVKTATITTSSGFSQQITLEDTRKVQRFTIEAPESDWIKLTIDEIYPGKRWNQESGITQFTVAGISTEERHALKLVEEMINTLDQIKTQDQLAVLIRETADLPLTSAHRNQITEKALSLSGLSLRHTFRQGKIGERYVPVISHTNSYNTTRYINGNMINETKFNDYTSGGYSENREGYTAVYQFINDAEQAYLLEVDITASTTISKYRKKSSWSGDDYRQAYNEKSKLKQKNTYIIAPGETLKDQVVVGEKQPGDFEISLSRIAPLTDKWIEQLDVAIKGDNAAIAINYAKDPLASHWHPAIVGNLARQSYMNLDYNINVGTHFDRDFASPVEITFNNNNDHDVVVVFEPNFMRHETIKRRKVTIKANASEQFSVKALGVKEKDLDLNIDLIYPTGI